MLMVSSPNAAAATLRTNTSGTSQNESYSPSSRCFKRPRSDAMIDPSPRLTLQIPSLPSSSPFVSIGGAGSSPSTGNKGFNHLLSSSSSPKYSFSEVVILLHKSLTRFANSFQYSLSQLTYITDNYELMQTMTQKFAEAVILFQQAFPQSLFLKKSSSKDHLDQELLHFLDQVLVCVLEEFVEGELQAQQSQQQLPGNAMFVSQAEVGFNHHNHTTTMPQSLVPPEYSPHYYSNNIDEMEGKQYDFQAMQSMPNFHHVQSNGRRTMSEQIDARQQHYMAMRSSSSSSAASSTSVSFLNDSIEAVVGEEEEDLFSDLLNGILDDDIDVNEYNNFNLHL